MAINASLRNHKSVTWDFLRKLTGLAEPESHLQGFTLALGDGSHWCVAGVPSSKNWMGKLVSILNLRQGSANGDNLLIILEGEDPIERAKRLGVPESGWIHLSEGARKFVDPDSGWINLNNTCLSLWYRRDSADLVVELKSPLVGFDGYNSLRFALQFVFRHSLKKGGLPLHTALVEHQGKGALLLGISGTGKSTCCRRLSPPWQARCDDEVLLTLAPDGRYLAHPFPTWSDYLAQREKIPLTSQNPSPLAGVFFIEQSSSDECLPADPSKALVETIVAAQLVLIRHLWYCDPEEAKGLRSDIFANACEVLKKVPSFRLRVSLTGRFWEKMEAALGIL